MQRTEEREQNLKRQEVFSGREREGLKDNKRDGEREGEAFREWKTECREMNIVRGDFR